MTTVRFTLNGAPASAEVENRRLLVEVLRDQLGLVGLLNLPPGPE